MTVDTSTSHRSWITNLQHRFRQQLLPIIADLRLAIILLLAIAIASMTGTVIEQGQSVEFYQTNYPEDPALFGFLTWKILLLVGLNHVYQTPWFLAILVAFGTSLTACTITRQIPALNAAKNWKFYDVPRQFQKLALSSEIPIGDRTDQKLIILNETLEQQGYQVFREGEMLYARKGLIGRIGPIVVHASMLLILLGAIVGSLTGVVAQQMIPSGDTITVQNFIDRGWLSSPERFRNWAIKVNRFWIDYLPNGAIDQFYSDLSIVNPAGEELTRKTIFVNEPLRYNGVVLYQTDWSISGVQVQLNQSPIFQLPMAQLQGTGQRLWGTWIPTKPDMSAGVSVIAKDLQGTLFIYDTAGEPIATVRAGGAVEVNGITLKVKALIGSTGLQIKSDPGIPLVYAGFGLLMLSSIASYVSHSQIWALSKEGMLYIGGRTNRAQVVFEREVIAIFDRVSVDTSSTVT